MGKSRKRALFITAGVLLALAVAGMVWLLPVIAGDPVPMMETTVFSGWPTSADVVAKWTVRDGGTIVLGRVTEIREPRWSTPDGDRPPDDAPPQVRATSGIYRVVVVDVERYIAEPQHARRLTIRAWGGTVGNHTFRWLSKAQQYEANERVVLFLTKSPSEASKASPLWTIGEKFSLSADGTASSEFEKMPFAELVREIETGLAEL